MRARLLLLAASLAAFGGSLFAGFHLDDYAIFSGSLPNWVHSAHALTDVTFWLNNKAGGQEPVGYHVVNLLLHLGAVLLAYECLRRLLPAGTALAAAAIFAVHPLQSEAVDYVAQRGVLLAALLCFAALLAWIEAQPWLGLLAFAAALLADPQCAFFPIVFLVVRRDNRPAGERVALWIAAVLGVAAAVRAPHPSYALALVTWRFARLFLIPWGFTVAPDVREPIWLAIAAAGAIAGIALWSWRKVPAELTWALAGLVLLIPSFTANPAADPRMYLPVFAFAVAAALLLARIPARSVAIVIVVILVAVSMSRTYVWMSEERLWREAVRRAPGQVKPKIELAKSLKAAEALELLARARQQAPYNPEIPLVMGKVLLDEQQYDGAVDELSRAVALNPNSAVAFNNRGVALATLGQITAASADFEHALALDPHFDEARENLKRLTGK